jgi:acetyl esterase
MTHKNDARLDKRLLATMSTLGLLEEQAGEAVVSQEMVDQYLPEAEKLQEQLLDVLNTDTIVREDIRRTSESIAGKGGNQIRLYIHSHANAVSGAPCVYHIHGGGMAITRADSDFYMLLRDEIAALGLIVVGVEFRNSSGVLGNHPFPAGLDDCFSGLQWLNINKRVLNISQIVVVGESGGGNLALALCLKAKQEGQLSLIDGVYALCPYI